MDSSSQPIASVSPVLADIPHVESDLMNISPLSGDGSTDGAAQSQASLRVQDLLNKQDWLLEQKVQLEAQVLASNPGFAEELDTMNAEELQQLCDSLQAELLVKTSVHDSRQNLLQSERINQAAMSALKSDDSSSAKVQSLFTEMTRLAEEVGKQHKENVELQAELDKYKRENRELQNKSRELYSHIEKKKKEKEEEIAVLTNDPSGKRSVNHHSATEVQTGCAQSAEQCVTKTDSG